MATLAELAELVSGAVVGNEQLEVSTALPIQDCDPTSITLVESEKYWEKFEKCEAAAAVVTKAIPTERPQLVVQDLHSAFIAIVQHLRPARPALVQPGISTQAVIDDSATIGEGSRIGALATIGAQVRIGRNCVVHPGVHVMANCIIEDHCELWPGVVLYPQTMLAERVILHAGVVVGADGFGYRQEEGRHQKAAQLGWVEIKSDVEIGSNSCIDRGVYGPTVIGEGTKIDNMVQVGHNCHIGRHNLLCSQVGIAGSSSTGDYVVMAGQVGVADHIEISDQVIVTAQSGVAHNLDSPGLYFGSPAIKRKIKLRELVHVSRLPETVKSLSDLRTRVAELESRLKEVSDGDEVTKAA